MRLEIDESPEVARRILADRSASEAAARAIAARRPSWITIAARGTSDHAAVYAQYLLETRLGLPTGLAKPSVTTIYGATLDWRGGLVLAISQSGRSPDVLAVVDAARAGGALTVAVTNDDTSPLASAAEIVIGCHAGPELAVPATKTYVAELVVLAALVGSLAPDAGYERALLALPETLAATLDTSSAWLDAAGTDVVERLTAADRALLVSRGYNLATALELALKLKETCGLFAEAYSTADFAHGPMVLARPEAPVLAVRPDGAMGRLVDETLAGVAARGGRAAVIGGPEVASVPGALALAPLPEELTPIAYVVPGQLVVESTARRRGLEPDAPIGLGKVTLTR
jgi:glucosamine--fructose-6-phosphate aminotransferase (isomerizing)